MEWCFLNALADDIEPVEEVFRSLRESSFEVSANEFLVIIFTLFNRGFITIQQAPMEAFEQNFVERNVIPSRPAYVVGDLGNSFREFFANGDYLRRYDGAGIPFGIYFDLTIKGREEWNHPVYQSFWPNDRNCGKD